MLELRLQMLELRLETQAQVIWLEQFSIGVVLAPACTPCRS